MSTGGTVVQRSGGVPGYGHYGTSAWKLRMKGQGAPKAVGGGIWVQGVKTCPRLFPLSPEEPPDSVQSLHHVLQPGLPQHPQWRPLCAQLLCQPPPVPSGQQLCGIRTLPHGESLGGGVGGVSRAQGWGPGGETNYTRRDTRVQKGKGALAQQVCMGRRSGGLSSPTSLIQSRTCDCGKMQW